MAFTGLTDVLSLLTDLFITTTARIHLQHFYLPSTCLISFRYTHGLGKPFPSVPSCANVTYKSKPVRPKPPKRSDISHANALNPLALHPRSNASVLLIIKLRFTQSAPHSSSAPGIMYYNGFRTLTSFWHQNALILSHCYRTGFQFIKCPYCN
jgi:hypothetical protein